MESKYYWTLESWGSDYPPENAEEIINAANDLLDEYAKTLDADAPGYDDAMQSYSDMLWEDYCRTGEI